MTNIGKSVAEPGSCSCGVLLFSLSENCPCPRFVSTWRPPLSAHCHECFQERRVSSDSATRARMQGSARRRLASVGERAGVRRSEHRLISALGVVISAAASRPRNQPFRAQQRDRYRAQRGTFSRGAVRRRRSRLSLQVVDQEPISTSPPAQELGNRADRRAACARCHLGAHRHYLLRPAAPPCRAENGAPHRRTEPSSRRACARYHIAHARGGSAHVSHVQAALALVFAESFATDCERPLIALCAAAVCRSRKGTLAPVGTASAALTRVARRL